MVEQRLPEYLSSIKAMRILAKMVIINVFKALEINQNLVELH